MRKRHPCPDARLSRIYDIQRVQKFGNMTWLESRQLAREEPYTWKLLLDAALIEGEAEPRAYKYAEQKQKQEDARDKKSKARPRLRGADPEE